MLRERDGRYLGPVTEAFTKDDGGFTQEDIELVKKRMASDSRRYTTKEVIEHLRQLGETHK